MLHLEFPNILHRDSYIKMIQEWKTFEKVPTSPSRLFFWETYEEFLDTIVDDLLHWRHSWICATLFFLVDSDSILWAIQIRHSIDHPNLRETGGHIGYGLRPSARKKGYASLMLGLWLSHARKLWLEKVLITVDDDNIASWKTIEKNGGIFERFTEKDAKKVRRYWIDTTFLDS